jgi:PQQ system protein
MERTQQKGNRPGIVAIWYRSALRRRRTVLAATILIAPILLFASGCNYGGLLRPSVLKQLNPDVVRLLNELPEVDRPNEDIVGRLFAHGGLSHATEGADGLMHDSIRIPEGQLIWQPAIIVMPHPGELEVELFNDDGLSLHAAIMPSNGDKQYVLLPIHTKGRAKIRLDGPGYYWFGCPVANHVGRGMLGLILVRGDVPLSAKLDRPEQQRP